MGDDGALRFGEQLRAVAADLDHMGLERLRIAGVDAVWRMFRTDSYVQNFRTL